MLDGNRYAELVGMLLYVSTTKRPEIAFAVGVLSRYMACLEEHHTHAAKSVLRHLGSAAEWPRRRPGAASERFGVLRPSKGMNCISIALLEFRSVHGDPIVGERLN